MGDWIGIGVCTQLGLGDWDLIAAGIGRLGFGSSWDWTMEIYEQLGLGDGDW